MVFVSGSIPTYTHVCFHEWRGLCVYAGSQPIIGGMTSSLSNQSSAVHLIGEWTMDTAARGGAGLASAKCRPLLSCIKVKLLLNGIDLLPMHSIDVSVSPYMPKACIYLTCLLQVTITFF